MPNLAIASTSFSDGEGGGGIDPKDVAIMLLEQQVAEFRTVMRRLLDSDGEEATAAMADAERLLTSLDTVDREEEFDQYRENYHASRVCDDCGTHKGVGTSYCPSCDADTLARMTERTNVIAPNFGTDPF